VSKLIHIITFPGYSYHINYINNVLAEEAITLLIMELEECDYRTATSFAVFGTPTPINTIYHDK